VNAVRDASLKALGFRSYADYLRSPMWRQISANVLAKARYRCKCCGERATQVHHKSYDVTTMRGANRGNLIPMCGACHKAAEFDGERKVELAEANARADQFRVPERYAPERPEPSPTKRERIRAERQARARANIERVAGIRESASVRWRRGGAR
jgi:hypothetical protein